jgi:glucose-1-phosphate thymidylyltransferase
VKGIILAGGTGSRLYPLTKVTNKHLLPVGRYPMIYWPLGNLIECGIREIMVITGVQHLDAIIRVLGSGRDLGVELTYRVQDEAGGIAQALGLCRRFVNSDRVMVILGDNIFLGDMSPLVGGFAQGARLMLTEHHNPERFGVATVSGDGRIVRVVEKPSRPESKLVVTGCYLYDGQVFDLIASLKPSGRGELEVTDVNNAYIRQGQADYRVLEMPWTDAGTFESLAEANLLTRDRRLKLYEQSPPTL